MGPTHFLPKFSHLVLSLTSTAFFLIYKGVSLAVIIYSASATFSTLLTTYDNTLLKQPDPCPSVTFIKNDNGTWRTLRHLLLKMDKSLESRWNHNPKYAPLGTQWLYFYDDEEKVTLPVTS